MQSGTGKFEWAQQLLRALVNYVAVGQINYRNFPCLAVNYILQVLGVRNPFDKKYIRATADCSGFFFLVNETFHSFTQVECVCVCVCVCNLTLVSRCTG